MMMMIRAADNCTILTTDQITVPGGVKAKFFSTVEKLYKKVSKSQIFMWILVMVRNNNYIMDPKN